MKHSELPWEGELEVGAPDVTGSIWRTWVVAYGAALIAETIAGDERQAKQRAAFIVKACNLHYELVNMVKRFDIYTQCKEFAAKEAGEDVSAAEDQLGEIQALLAKAKEK